MNWAWGLPLKPSIKFVLLALADASDDGGYCWPSISTLAKKTCLDARSVQRILNQLKAQGFLRVERRHRPDGSPTSNGYRLALDPPPGKMSPPPGMLSPPPGTVSPPGDTGVTLIVIEPPKEPTPPLPRRPTMESTANDAAAKQGTERGGGGELIFPKALSPREVRLAKKRLAVLPSTLAQEILDELAGRLATHRIRGSPLSYLRALIARAQGGTFTPEVGVRVAQSRENGSMSKPGSEIAARPSPGVSDPSAHLARIRQTLRTPGKCHPESE